MSFHHVTVMVEGVLFFNQNSFVAIGKKWFHCNIIGCRDLWFILYRGYLHQISPLNKIISINKLYYQVLYIGSVIYIYIVFKVFYIRFMLYNRKITTLKKLTLFMQKCSSHSLDFNVYI